MVEHIYDVTGMTCAACSARVKRTMDRLDGVSHCEVNLLTGKMTLGYDEKALDFTGIQAAIEKAGYGVREPELADERSVAAEEEKEQKPRSGGLSWRRCAPRQFFYLNISHMIPAITPPVPAIFHTYPIINALLQLVLASIVLWCGRGFFIRGYRSLFEKARTWTRSSPSARRLPCWRAFTRP